MTGADDSKGRGGHQCGGRPGLLCAYRQGALSALSAMSATRFLFNFRRISADFYLLISTAFLMHLSAYTKVLKHLPIAPPFMGHRVVHLARLNLQASLA